MAAAHASRMTNITMNDMLVLCRIIKIRFRYSCSAAMKRNAPVPCWPSLEGNIQSALFDAT
jgi:hypothetical protein